MDNPLNHTRGAIPSVNSKYDHFGSRCFKAKNRESLIIRCGVVCYRGHRKHCCYSDWNSSGTITLKILTPYTFVWTLYNSPISRIWYLSMFPGRRQQNPTCKAIPSTKWAFTTPQKESTAWAFLKSLTDHTLITYGTPTPCELARSCISWLFYCPSGMLSAPSNSPYC